jgi:hypothetical protein
MINTKYTPIIIALILMLSSVNIVTAEETTPHTIYVSTNGNNTNNGLTPQTSKQTIVNAVKSANDGDIIQIAPGTYTEEDIIIEKKLTLRGTDPTNTIIKSKGQDYWAVITIRYNSDVLIQKLTITRHKTKKTSRGLINYGSLTVEDSIITGHRGTDRGGGIANQWYSMLTVKHCNITNNSATCSGGGIFNSNTTVLIEDSIISNNTVTGVGGGIHNACGGFLTIMRSVISDNKAYAPFGIGYRGLGGGIQNEGKMIIQDSLITDNKANYGGGYYGFNEGVWISELILENSTISNNRAKIKGGGIYITKKGHLTMKNSPITNNKPQNIYKQ